MQISKTVENGSAKQICVLLKTSAKTTLSELKGQLALSVTQLNVNQSYLLNQTTIKCNCLNINGTIMSAQNVRVETLLNIRHHTTTLLLLFAISLFAKVQLLLPECFCEGTMLTLSVF